MSNRPSIPAKIRRAVLVEAGHRCAIHTCKQTPIEVHHIIPYSICKKHELENLITLCPNCHTRVHNGEIDRKSLRIYKDLLSRDENSDPLGSIFNDQKGSEKEDVLIENNNLYEFYFSFPLLKNKNLEEINAIIKYNAIKDLHLFRQIYWEEKYQSDVSLSYFEGDFKVTYINDKFISLEAKKHTYGAGAAHGQEITITFNYKINPVIPLELSDVFLHKSDYLFFISKYSRECLIRTLGENIDKKWLYKGTEPNKDNFSKFSLNNKGIEFIFDEYQVAPYCYGESTILIAYEHIGDILNQEILTLV